MKMVLFVAKFIWGLTFFTCLLGSVYTHVFDKVSFHFQYIHRAHILEIPLIIYLVANLVAMVLENLDVEMICKYPRTYWLRTCFCG